MARRVQAERDMFEIGTKATAVVKSAETTGVLLNDVNMQIILRLRVQPLSEPEFAYQRKMYVPLYGIPRAGDVIDVAYDPNDKSKVALATDWDSDTGGGHLLILRHDGEPGSTGASDRVIEQLERLHQLKREGALTEPEFELQKARIISEQGT